MEWSDNIFRWIKIVCHAMPMCPVVKMEAVGDVLTCLNLHAWRGHRGQVMPNKRWAETKSGLGPP